MSCKVCGSPAEHFASIDAAQGCAYERLPAPARDAAVEYRRCAACGFIGTRHFDDWSFGQWRERIYNDGYVTVDPQCVEDRPRTVAAFIDEWFRDHIERLSVLDYGGGDGRCAMELRERGFAAQAWDPVYCVGERPSRRFDLVLAVEVLEHLTQPREGLAHMLGCVADGGMLLLLTQLAADDVTPGWWYLAPRNGHVSLHTPRSLNLLANELGASVVSAKDNGTHCLLPGGITPWFAKDAIRAA